ncbi:hypothetical protein KUA24_123 [Vibrio phage HNL01]|nr:hypothetical protein KUA24_123 [Vibrio phage HNL01]
MKEVMIEISEFTNQIIFNNGKVKVYLDEDLIEDVIEELERLKGECCG